MTITMGEIMVMYAIIAVSLRMIKQLAGVSNFFPHICLCRSMLQNTDT